MFHRRSELVLLGPGGEIIWHKKAYGEEPNETILNKLHHLSNSDSAIVPRSDGAIDWLTRLSFRFEGLPYQFVSRCGHNYVALPSDHVSHKVFLTDAHGNFIEPGSSDRGGLEDASFRENFHPIESELDNVSFDILVAEAVDSRLPVHITTFHPPNLVRTLRVFLIHQLPKPIVVWLFDVHNKLQFGTAASQHEPTTFWGIGYLEYDADGKITHCNKVVGWLMREVREHLEPGKSLWDALDKFAELHPEAAESILDRSPADSCVHPGSDGRILIVQETGLSKGGFARVYVDATSVVAHVTAPKGAEEPFSQTESQAPETILENLQRSTRTAIFYFESEDSNPIWIANPAYLLPRDSWSLESAETLRVHPSDWEALKSSLENSPSNGPPFRDRRVRLISETGFIAWVRLIFTRSEHTSRATTYFGVAIEAEQVSTSRRHYSTSTSSQTSSLSAITDEQVQTAIANNEFELHYQPIVDAVTEEPKALEALLRWRRSDASFVRPSQFIPAIEHSISMVDVGRWVLRRACEDSNSFNAFNRADLPIFVNVAVRQVRSRFARDYEVATTSWGVPSRLLGVEITESAFGQGSRQMQETIRQLRRVGCPIAMDDFGTGFSSLAYLKEFPIQIVKLDAWFARELDFDERNQKMFRAIKNMCAALNLKIVVEGVERKAQADWLKHVRCDLAQGYHYSRPLSRSELLVWLSSVRE